MVLTDARRKQDLTLQDKIDQTKGELEQRLIRTVRDAARGAGVILISDYGKGVVTDALIAAAREAAAETGAKVIVDSKARSFARYGDIDIVKPNASSTP